MQRRLKLLLAYDGSGYHGWQRQKNAPTVQEALEEALARLLGEEVRVTGSGRTDAGVHALGQWASFTTACPLPLAKLPAALNGLLPGAIRALRAEEAEPGFDARRDACWKRYLYRLYFAWQPSPFAANYAWQLGEELDLAGMEEAAAYLLGPHDFSAFRSSGSTAGSPVRTIYQAGFACRGRELLFYIAGDGFLYHMVRNLVWTLVQVGRGLRSPGSFLEELGSERCTYLNSPAPAAGLYLQQVGYQPYEPGPPQDFFAEFFPLA